MKKFRYLTVAFFVGISSLLAAGEAFSAVEKPRVETVSGTLEGQSSRGVFSFLGIPYGADTGGKNRFLPPQPPATWSGVRRADQFGPQCAHRQPPMQGDITKVLIYSDLPHSEDCLTLNVWTPAVKDDGKRPVMVYFHGGGFFMGSSADRYYEGSNLSRDNDVVVVTLNHRLSVFGYLQPGAGAGPEYANAGAAGMLDLVQGLEWVRDNIARFGGDPDNVTIFGQSGGGIKVAAIMAMPAAKGLYHKAIMQSGPGRYLNTPEQAAQLAGAVFNRLGVSGDDIAALQAVPAETLLDAADGGMRLLPVMGNSAIPDHPFADSAPAQSAHVPLLIGGMKDEATSSLLSDPEWRGMDDAALNQRVVNLVGAEDADRVIAMYRQARPQDEPMFLWASIRTDSGFFGENFTVADLKSRQPAPVYVYRSDWHSPVLGGVTRAMHAGDLPFVWDNVDVAETLVGSGPEQAQMAKMFSRAFANFARTGNPGVPDILPEWPAYDAEDRPVMLFDVPPRLVNNPDADKVAYWNDLRRKAMNSSATR